MKKNVIIVVLLLAITGLLFWGISERKNIKKAELLIENGNEGSFLTFSENVAEMSKLMDEITVCSDEVLISQKLAQVTKLASHAQRGLISIPVSHNVALNATDFLSLCEDYSYSLLTSHLNGASLTEDDKKSLEKLSENCENMAKDIKSFESGRTNDFSWYDISYEFIDDNSGFSNMFSSFEKGYENFEGIKYNGKYSLKDDKSKQNEKEVYDYKTIESSLNETFSGYDGVSIQRDSSQKDYHSFTVSENGISTKFNYGLYDGKLISARTNKTSQSEKITQEEAEQSAEKFLKAQKIDSMKIISQQINNNALILNYVYEDENAQYPSDSLKIEVSLEDGDIISFDAEEYYKNHKERKYEQNKLDINEVQSNLGGSLEVSEQKSLVVKASDGSENGAYQYKVTKNGKSYIIVIDAQSGREIYVQRIEDN